MGGKIPLSTIAGVTGPALTTLPNFAISTGIATGDHGNRVGVYGSSVANVGVWADSAQSIGLYATGGLLAAQFDGNVEILSGDLLCHNADCAEEFDVLGECAEPGTVMVLTEGGVVVPSSGPYDTRVAGVISGAGRYKPAIVLDRQTSRNGRRPIALLGKAYSKVDAQYGSIRAGDLLTTSPTVGHAMKITDREKAFGAVLGKALNSWSEGRGLIPLLVTLH